MAKLTLTNVSNLSGAETAAINTINNNSQSIEDALENTLSLDGTSPNSMNADIDMNANDLLNVGLVETDELTLGGVVISGVGDIENKGDKGWSPSYAIVSDSERRVHQLIGYVGGEGTEPTDNVGLYVTNVGYTPLIGNGADIRGPSGGGTGDVVAANNGSDFASKPTTFANLKQAATTSATGVLEIGTLSEVLAGTPTNLAVVSDIMAAIIAIICPVGAIQAFAQTTAPTGWLELNGASIGDATSGATGRANADTVSLFSLLWSQTSNTDLPIQTSTGVPSTRGVDAATDFTAHKRMPLQDVRGFFLRALDNSRGVDTGRALLSAQADLVKAHTHTGTTSINGTHTHLVQSEGTRYGSNPANPGGHFYMSSGDSNPAYASPNINTGSGGGHNHSFTTDANTGNENRPGNYAVLYAIKY